MQRASIATGWWVAVLAVLTLLTSAGAWALWRDAPTDAARWQLLSDLFKTAMLGGALATFYRWTETMRAEKRREAERAADIWSAQQALIRDIYYRFCNAHGEYKKGRRKLRVMLNGDVQNLEMQDLALDGPIACLEDAQLACESLYHQSTPMVEIFSKSENAEKMQAVCAGLDAIQEFLNHAIKALRKRREKPEYRDALKTLIAHTQGNPDAKRRIETALFNHSDQVRNNLAFLLVREPPIPIS